MPIRSDSHKAAAPRPRKITEVRLPSYVFETPGQLARHVAQLIANVIQERNSLGQNAVLALPSGSTPVDVYRRLIEMHQEEGLDFAHVVTFNLDEYFGLQPDQLQSYHRWMWQHFFRHVNAAPENIHIPDGSIPLEEVAEHCRHYERTIEDAGGIDVALLGIGRNGHIGFNEPFSIRNSRTRLCTLDPVTRRAAASDFFGEENVPTHAITMGMGTILQARKILLVALGEHKAAIIRETAEGPIADRVPASFLQDHPDASLLLDTAAASQLTQVMTPWLTGNVVWTDELIKRAVLWLCNQAGKALLKLDDDDFRNHNLHQLLRHHGPAEAICQRVFQWMQSTICHHPAGAETPKRIICFSPHPDDDVISMGGTLIRLVEDGHEVHIAYMTSGNIAVFDHDASRVALLAREYNQIFGIDREKSAALEEAVRESFRNKKAGDPDSESVREIKGLIRRNEARAGANVVGCRDEHLHFLDLPFYRTGTIEKRPLGHDDIEILVDLLVQIQPQQVYLAGDLSDPHGTHRKCAEAILKALRRWEAEGATLPEVLMYRGAWQEYDLHEIDLAVPLSPGDLHVKRKAIFMHESQKDEALFPGSDPREFWQRAEDRNKGTADRFNRIGLPEFFGIEAFVRWVGQEI